MRITFETEDGRKTAAKPPYEGAQYVIVAGMQCACSRAEDLQVAGIVNGTIENTDYHMVSKAACARCKGIAGTLRVDFDTIFGREEDERVAMRCRVY